MTLTDPVRTVTAGDSPRVAPRVEEALRPLLGGPLPVRLHAWDGSEAGPADDVLVGLPGPRVLAPGVEGSRVRRVSLVGDSQAFRDGRTGVDQIPLRRPGGPPVVPDPAR